jgi:uncharacterized protein (DUF1499 family)
MRWIIAVLPLLIYAAGAFSAWRRLIPPLAGLGISMLALPAAMLIVLLLLLARLRGTGETAPPAHFLIMFVLALLPLLLFTPFIIRLIRYPMINDVTTDTGNPPSFEAVGELSGNSASEMVFPKENADVIASAFPDLAPVSISAEDAFETVLKTARDYGWEIVREDREKGIIEAVAETAVYHFRDYIVLRLRKDGDRMIVDMRSKSRDGKSDLGTNSLRISAFLEALR